MLDPKLNQIVIKAHEEAIAKDYQGYIDPFTGYLVMTSNYLKNRGHCCGVGCRHCPWPIDVQKKAGRPEV